MARDGNAEKDDGMSVIMSKDVGALIAKYGGNLDRWRDDQLGNVMSPASTTLVVLLCQVLVTNSFAVVFWFPICESLALFF